MDDGNGTGAKESGRRSGANEACGRPSVSVERRCSAPGEVSVGGSGGHLITLHLNDPHRLVYLLDGRCWEGIELKGDVGVVPAGSIGSCRSESESEDANLLLDGDFFRCVLDDAGLDEDNFELLETFPVRDPYLERIGFELLSEQEIGGPGEALYAESLANLLALHLIRHHSSIGRGAKARIDRESPAGFGNGALRKAVEYIEDNLTEDLTLAELARAAGMSRSRFSQAFKQATGRAPHRYVIERRAERARRLLERGDLPIAEVAREVGFYDQSHLNRHFKCIFGVTPTQL